MYYFAAAEETSTTKLPAFFQKFQNIVRGLRVRKSLSKKIMNVTIETEPNKNKKKSFYFRRK